MYDYKPEITSLHVRTTRLFRAEEMRFHEKRCRTEGRYNSAVFYQAIADCLESSLSYPSYLECEIPYTHSEE